ncbi:MAG: DUF1573 domain-containing protein [Flavobacteriales bacterium]|nr:DUF1573 domain-containing protein [Flavobacteriales bacterium]
MRIALVILTLLACQFQISAQNNAVFGFEKTVLKFPKAEGGDVLYFTYKFKNTGSAPLIISDIKVACSCTTPAWPEYPIMPGKSDSITVEFNTKTVWGWQEKELRIYSNASESYTSVYFKGTVKKGEYVKKVQAEDKRRGD